MKLAYDDWDMQAIFRVLTNMRPSDAEEVFACMERDEPEDIFAHWVAMRRLTHLTEVVWSPNLLEGQPVAVLNIVSVSPGVATASMIATPEMTKRGFVVWAKRLRKIMPDICRQAGLHRLQCQSITGHSSAHQFLKNCGWKREGTARALGRNGENFINFSAIASDFEDQRGAQNAGR